MEQNPVDSLTVEQRRIYDALNPDQKLEINTKITDKYSITDVVNNVPGIINGLRQQVRLAFRENPLHINLSDEAIDGAFDRAKQELINEYDSEINLMLQGEQVQPRRDVGAGIIGLLINKVVYILSRPVGGKLRKTSNKKRPTTRRIRRRSSNARKARQSRKSRSTRRR